jgi:hypothetical protein
VPPQPLPPVVQWCLDHGAASRENSKAFFESYLLPFRSSTSSNGVFPSVIRLVKPIFKELVGCVLSFRGRATQGAWNRRGRCCFYSRASFRAPWLILLLRGTCLSTRTLITVTTAEPIERQEILIYCLPSLAFTHPLLVGGHRHLSHFRGPVSTPCPLRSPFMMASRLRQPTGRLV